MAAIREVPFMCRNFKWHEAEHVLFSLKVTGRILKDRIISEVAEDVQNALFAAYDRESSTRREVVRLHEIYKIIKKAPFPCGKEACLETFWTSLQAAMRQAGGKAAQKG